MTWRSFAPSSSCSGCSVLWSRLPPTPRAPRGSQAPPAHTAACCSRRRDTPSAYKLTTAYPLFAQAYRLSAYVYRHFGPELFVDSKGISSSAPLTSHRG